MAFLTVIVLVSFLHLPILNHFSPSFLLQTHLHACVQFLGAPLRLRQPAFRRVQLLLQALDLGLQLLSLALQHLVALLLGLELTLQRAAK